MLVFVYEFATGGGAWSLGGGGALSEGSLLAEGSAMVATIVADFAALPEVEVWTTWDHRLPRPSDPRCQTELIGSAAQEHAKIARLAAAADWTLIIAPEFGGILLERARWVLNAGGRLLSPGADVIELASDKQRTAEHLTSRQVRVPQGGPWQPLHKPPEIPFPAVAKPLDGCGSIGVRRVNSEVELAQLAGERPLRIERWVPGLPASVGVLCGPGQSIPLPACEQRLSSDGRFSYLGGRTPLTTALDERACRLALAAVRALPPTTGYLGVDLVLGSSPHGDDDFVIEINPRLTTSYVGLRTFCRENLAAAMLAVAHGERPALSWRDEGVQFTPDGQVTAVPFREAKAP